MKRAHAYYSGNVHGVGFRFTAIDMARRHGITGWAKNTADGRVEIVAEGEEASLSRFFMELEMEMAHYISDKKIAWEAANNSFREFGIEY